MERVKKIIFVTSNDGKVSTARQFLKGVELVKHNADFIEPRSDDIKEISYQKVLQAHKMVSLPCIAEDSGFFVNSLNGFPGSYVNHVLGTIGISGLLKLMEGASDRTCFFRSCLAYYDGENLRYFESESHGRLSEKIHDKNANRQWSELWKIFIPDDFDITFSEFTDADFEIYYRSKKPSSIQQFAEWYESFDGYVDEDIEN